MRRARAQDYWRHVYAMPYHRRIQSFSYSNINGLGNGEINFRGGISAVCGGNGVGKSTIMDAMACTIIGAQYGANRIAHGRFVNASFQAQMVIDDAEVIRTLGFAEGETQASGHIDCETVYINPANLAMNVISFLERTANFAEYLESLESRIATAQEVAQLSYIIGKNYEGFETFEIEDYSLEGQDNETSFPYFRVTSGGTQYSSEMMGLGELSLFLLVWKLDNMSENSILLIEEPETYISPSSQKKFMDFMARMSDIKHIWIVVTTHSPSIVDQIPLESITLLSRGAAGVTVIDTPSRFQLDEVLDKSHSYSGVLFVEDLVAQAFLSSVLSRMALDIHQRYELLISEGEATLSQLKNCFPPDSAWLEVAVIYDGDQRQRQEKGKIPQGFLPGAASPESLLWETARANQQRLADGVSRPLPDVTVVLDALEGRERHDWLDELAGRLRVEKHILIDVLAAICLDTNEQVRKEAADLIAMIRAAFSPA